MAELFAEISNYLIALGGMIFCLLYFKNLKQLNLKIFGLTKKHIMILCYIGITLFMVLIIVAILKSIL
jgi:hypothetical protein